MYCLVCLVQFSLNLALDRIGNLRSAEPEVTRGTEVGTSDRTSRRENLSWFAPIRAPNIDLYTGAHDGTLTKSGLQKYLRSSSIDDKI